MSADPESYPQENSSRNLVIMLVLLLLILGVVFTVIFLFKPAAQAFDTGSGEMKNSPKEHIESLDPLIGKVYNLAGELALFDELFDILVYSEKPNVNNIGNFVASYMDYESQYAGDRRQDPGTLSPATPGDSSVISFERQRDYLDRSLETLIESIHKKKKVFLAVPVAYPIAKEQAQIVSGFGMRDHPILKERRMHNGIDIKAPVGTAVVATANGKVIKTEDKPGYGRSCVIQHDFGFQTRYAHMVRMTVGINSYVRKGEQIGFVGNTGLSVAAHLHYEVIKNGQPLNPSYFIFEGLTREEYKEVIALGSKTTEILSF